MNAPRQQVVDPLDVNSVVRVADARAYASRRASLTPRKDGTNSPGEAPGARQTPVVGLPAHTPTWAGTRSGAAATRVAATRGSRVVYPFGRGQRVG
jgi:hypothetical protein